MDLVVAGELELYGSHGMAAADYPAMLELVTTGPVRLDRLVGAVIGLDAAPAALMAMDRPPTTAGITVVDLLR
jgi:alcohol dehydrogenase